MTTANGRTADHSVDTLFLERWSPRAFDGRGISGAEAMSLFEAARWSASSYNSQPWRFLYARRDTPQWEPMLSLLNPSNRSWAERSALLVVVVSNSLMSVPGKDKPVPSHSHSFDTGAACASLALQATRMGLQAHGMVGFDMERAFTELNVPVGHRVEAAFAVGHIGDKSVLPPELQAREMPNARQPVASFTFEGGFPPGTG